MSIKSGAICSECGRELTYRELDTQELRKSVCADCLLDQYDTCNDVIADPDFEIEEDTRDY